MGIYHRPRSPYWWIRVPHPPGPPLRESTRIPVDGGTPPQSKRNRDLAQRAYAVRAGEIAQARYQIPSATPPPPLPTLAAHLAWYQQHVSATKRGASRERVILQRFSRELGERRVDEVTRGVVLEWRAKRAADGTAPATVNRELALLRHVLGLLVPGTLEVNPARGIRPLPAPRPAPTVLSHADEARLLAALDPSGQALIVCALDTLLRGGDCATLTTAQDRGTWLDVPLGKAGHHEVPVSARLRAALDRLTPCEAHGHYWPIWAHLEPEARGIRVAKWLGRVCRETGLHYGRRTGGLTFHVLRHTGATRMLQAGVDIRTVQDIGGWRSLVHLQRYLHPTDATRRAAVEAVGTQAGF